MKTYETSGPPNYSGSRKPKGDDGGRPRGNGLCPRCHERPRVDEYCQSCDSAVNHERYERRKARRTALVARHPELVFSIGGQDHRVRVVNIGSVVVTCEWADGIVIRAPIARLILGPVSTRGGVLRLPSESGSG